MRLIFILLLSLISFSSWALEDYDRMMIEQRIKPVGNVRVEEAASLRTESQPSVTQAVAKTATVPGQETYEQYCHTCHAQGIAGAPKFRDKALWEPRLNAKKMDGLVQSALHGLNAMPPKGTCSECSEEEIKNAINYMLPQ